MIILGIIIWGFAYNNPLVSLFLILHLLIQSKYRKARIAKIKVATIEDVLNKMNNSQVKTRGVIEIDATDGSFVVREADEKDV